MVPEGPLRLASAEAKKADVALVLGSSMSGNCSIALFFFTINRWAHFNELLVSPFCDLPWKAKKVILVCLQDTVADRRVTLKINAKCDQVPCTSLQGIRQSHSSLQVMHGLMAGLGKDPELEFEYKQSILMSHKRDASGRVFLHVGGGRKNEVCTCVQEVKVTRRDGEEPRLMEEGDGVWDMQFDLPEPNARAEVAMELVMRPEYTAPSMHFQYVLQPDEPTGQRYLVFKRLVHYHVDA